MNHLEIKHLRMLCAIADTGNMTRAAVTLCISQSALDAFLSERAGITLDLAQRLGYALGQGPRYWLALQMQYDLWQAERSVPDGVRRVAWPGHGRRRSRSLSSLTAAA